MTYKGYIRQGVIVLQEPAELREGAEVLIEILGDVPVAANDSAPTLAERLAGVIGQAQGMPENWSAEHDAYLRQQSGQ
ncbi:MAG: hypothetical protein GC168_19400 [Candidatus Hydrogenedens sp.]|nr:hypothetical protein [Candidatus Hydrogenedens sp.]